MDKSGQQILDLSSQLQIGTPLSSKRIYRIYHSTQNGFTGFTSVVKTDLPDSPKRIYRIYLCRENGFTTLKTDLPDLPLSRVAHLTTPSQLLHKKKLNGFG